jgi:S1-C subfamily serine protease
MSPFEDPFFRRFFGPESPRPREFKQQGLGSGVVVQPDLVLTNNHVIEGADEIRVTARDKREFQAKVVGADSKSDLAVLRLSAPASQLSPITGKLRNLIAAAGASAKVTLEIRREGKLKTVTVNLGEAPPSAAPSGGGSPGSIDGVTVDPLTPALRDRYRIPREVTGGVVITAVQPGSQAASAGLRPGDVVLEVNRKAVTAVEEFQAEWARAQDQALLLVQRGEATLFIAVRK